MATGAHLESLERKHQQLESEIDKAMASPSADDLSNGARSCVPNKICLRQTA